MPDGDRWALRHLPFYGRWYRFLIFWPGCDKGLEAARVDPDYPDPQRAVSEVNDFARQMNIPVDLGNAMDIVLRQPAQAMDVGEVNDRIVPRQRACESAAIGDVSDDDEGRLPPPKGKPVEDEPRLAVSRRADEVPLHAEVELEAAQDRGGHPGRAFERPEVPDPVEDLDPPRA